LKEAGVLAIGISETQIRMVTHCDVKTADIDKTIDAVRAILASESVETK
jgi:threonine aldolase